MSDPTPTQRNPYAPPGAAVADAAPDSVGERPRAVSRAVILIWISLGLAALSSIFGPQRPQGAAQWVGGAIGYLIVYLIGAWFIGKVAKGRNWARVTLLVLMVIGLAVIAMTWRVYVYMLQAMPVIMVISVAQTLLQVVALYLLFSPPARPWFASRA